MKERNKARKREGKKTQRKRVRGEKRNMNERENEWRRQRKIVKSR